jgi:hypothetical protein
MRILLVDDEDAILQIASGARTSRSYGDYLHNNEDALRLYQNGAYEAESVRPGSCEQA